MKIFMILFSAMLLTACSTAPYPLISEKNCAQTCELKGLELEDYDTEDCCYCKERD